MGFRPPLGAVFFWGNCPSSPGMVQTASQGDREQMAKKFLTVLSVYTDFHGRLGGSGRGQALRDPDDTRQFRRGPGDPEGL